MLISLFLMLLLLQKQFFQSYLLIVKNNLSFLFLDHFHVLSLKFTKHLDMYNPNIPEWREDIGRVVTRLLAKVLS